MMTSELEAKQQALKEQIIEVTHELYLADVVTAGGGNISGRIPGTDIIWITPTKKFKGSLTVDDLIRIDWDGNVLEGHYKPSIEWPMHTGIFKNRPDVFGVVHTHSPFGIAIGITGACVPPFSFEALSLCKMPIIPVASAGEGLGRVVPTGLGSNNGAFLQHHGVVTVGLDVRRAADLTLLLEHVGKVWRWAKDLRNGAEPDNIPQAMLDEMAKRRGGPVA